MMIREEQIARAGLVARRKMEGNPVDNLALELERSLRRVAFQEEQAANLNGILSGKIRRLHEVSQGTPCYSYGGRLGELIEYSPHDDMHILRLAFTDLWCRHFTTPQLIEELQRTVEYEVLGFLRNKKK